jgi:hypothetical protein
MKIAHCPYCAQWQSVFTALGGDRHGRQPQTYLRRAHMWHNVPRTHRRALIRNGRKP